MQGKTMREALNEVRSFRDTTEGGPGSGPQKGGKKYSSADIKKAYGILNDPRYKQGNFSGAAKAIDKLSPGLSDHPDVKNAMKRANEALDLPATGDTTTSSASQELEEIVESIDDDTLIQIAESNGMGELIVLDEDGNLANRDELLELAPLAALATIARLTPAAVKVAKKAVPVVKKAASTAKDAITKYVKKLDTPKPQPIANLSKADRAAVIPSTTNTGHTLKFSKNIIQKQKGFQKNLKKGIPNEQVDEEKINEILPALAVGAAAAATGAAAYKAGGAIYKGISKIKKNLSNYGKRTSNPAKESVEEATFSKSQIDALVKGFGPLGGLERNKIKMDKVAGILAKLPKDALMQLSKANLPMVSKIAKELMKEEIDEAVVGLPFSRTLMYIIKTDRNTAEKIKSFLADNGEKYPIYIDDNGSGQITLDAYNYTGGEKKAALAAAQAIAKKFNVKVNATR